MARVTQSNPENPENPENPPERKNVQPESTSSVITYALLINVGPENYHWLEEPELRAQIRAEFGVECAEVLRFDDRRCDTQAIHPRRWRALARGIDGLLRDLRAAIPAATCPRIVIAGRGPLTLFAYLGAESQLLTGRLIFANHRRGCTAWDWLGRPTHLPGVDGPSPFAVEAPSLGRERQGRIALVIHSSGEYAYDESMLAPLVEEEGATFLGTYQITRKGSHREAPLGPAELAFLRQEVQGFLQWFGKECPEGQGVVVAYAGPAWLAFWLSRELNPNVVGRVDFVHQVARGPRRYTRGLTLPMGQAPWFANRAKVLFVGAEPDSLGRTRGAKVKAMIEGELERELGRGETAIYELFDAGAATLAGLARKLDRVSPDILHLHMHGAEDRSGALALEDPSGSPVRVDAESLLAILRGCEVRPALVVLSACHSAALAEAIIAEGIAEIVIFTTDEVQYKVTVDLASALYAALARGRSITAAIDQTMGTIRGRWREAAAAKIGWRPAAGIDPSKVVLFPAAGRR